MKVVQRAADSAEEDAEFAIRYAYWAVGEAGYAVLDATLARLVSGETDSIFLGIFLGHARPDRGRVRVNG